MVRAGELSARELVQRLAGAHRGAQPAAERLRARSTPSARWRRPRRSAPGDERPFAGVPIAIKNNRAVSGLRLTYGCSLMAEYVADYDHNVTRRLKEAGFIVVGTTTLPEYGILPVTEARLFGPTRNPWDLERTPGGSSGGSAAAVAAGMVPVAHGNDGGGSIRIPAACCGLVGLKPAPRAHLRCARTGRVAAGDRRRADPHRRRHRRDPRRARRLRAGDATWAPPPAEPFARSGLREPARLRIAATTLPPIPEAAVDPLCAQAVARRRDAAARTRARCRGGRSAVAGRGPPGAVRRGLLHAHRRCRSPSPGWSPAGSRAPRTWSR